MIFSLKNANLYRFAFFILVMSFVANASFSQFNLPYKKDSITLSKVGKTIMNVDIVDRLNESIKVPFNKIKVVDVRFDTSYIGIPVTVSLFKIYTTKADFKDGLSKGLSDYLNKFYSSNFYSGNNEMVCYVKQFSAYMKDSLPGNLSIKRLGKLRTEIEFYYKAGELFYPAVRIDTTFANWIDDASKLKEMEKILAESFDMLTYKLSNLDTLKLLKRKAYTVEAVNSRMQNKFNIPILKDQNIKKGIYANASEFLNNNPSITNFQVYDNGKEGVNLIDEDGNIINILSKFGYNDGISCNVLARDQAFPLIRINNGFQFIYKSRAPIRFNIYFPLDLQILLDDETFHFK